MGVTGHLSADAIDEEKMELRVLGSPDISEFTERHWGSAESSLEIFRRTKHVKTRVDVSFGHVNVFVWPNKKVNETIRIC